MCGIFGIFNHRDSARLTNLGLFAVQHRGQESAGIAVSYKGKIKSHAGMGLVSEVFNDTVLDSLPGRMAIGHVRYSTAGVSQNKNSQPLVSELIHGQVAVSLNGNLTNTNPLRRKLEKNGAIFQTTTDTELIFHLMARQREPIENAIIKSLAKMEGAYSYLFLTPTKLIAARDRMGFRPLVMGRNRKSIVFASETSALETVGAKFIREVEPGEIVVVSANGIKSIKPFQKCSRQARCIFELVYLARPDSVELGHSVESYRDKMGRLLANELKGIKADAVVPILDSGTYAALGFSAKSGIPFNMWLVRNHYLGRSFIKNTQQLRDMTVKLKLAPIKEAIKGKDVILVDDSIVRGTTSRRLVKMLKNIGARKVHMVLSSPPIISPCYYGIDTPNRSKLIAHNYSVEQIKKFLGVDTLHYLSLANLLKATGGDKKKIFCTSCFTGNYLTKTPEDFK
ncbi:MAG TPA: amidophosphoribosyltransferase [Elusimicrobiales bacterium]|nr:amidophosphoribosyltransferase [Elusimicrobiales bacterium]